MEKIVKTAGLITLAVVEVGLVANVFYAIYAIKASGSLPLFNVVLLVLAGLQTVIVLCLFGMLIRFISGSH